MPLVEKRYAEALVRVGLKQNTLDVFQNDLEKVNEIISSNKELRKFFINPGFNSKDKKSVIEKLCNKETNVYTLNFLKLLIDKNRMKNISEIVNQYSILADEIRKCLNVKVVTSTEISKDQLNKIGEKFKEQYRSKEVKIDYKIDPLILGGVIVKIGDKMIDGSIKGKLDGMLNAL